MTTGNATLDCPTAAPAGAVPESPLLSVRGLHARYSTSAGAVIHGLDFDVAPGGITTLLGANGAGKTTTLRAVCGMVRTEGSISLAGQAIAGQATENIARLGVAHVPDGRGTFLHLSVQENLRLGAYTRRDKVGVAEDIERMCGYFPRLKERWQQQAGTLSGGEQQMLAVARALMMRPRLLLLDEPSFGLAPLVVAELFKIFARVNREGGVAMLLVEQNAALALKLAQQAYLLETGRVVMAGSAETLRNDASVRRSYLGY
jgi:branched-chain amino acid transport system ATP-binding protein